MALTAGDRLAGRVLIPGVMLPGGGLRARLVVIAVLEVNVADGITRLEHERLRLPDKGPRRALILAAPTERVPRIETESCEAPETCYL